MSESKYTTGQWVVTNGTEKKKWERRFYVSAENPCPTCHATNSHHICVSLESAVGLQEAYANAKLIAAAPAMYKALEELIHLHLCEQEGLLSGQPTPEQWFEAVSNAINALDKAIE